MLGEKNKVTYLIFFDLVKEMPFLKNLCKSPNFDKFAIGTYNIATDGIHEYQGPKPFFLPKYQVEMYKKRIKETFLKKR